jgi:hypothetical protein
MKKKISYRGTQVIIAIGLPLYCEMLRCVLLKVISKESEDISFSEFEGIIPECCNLTYNAFYFTLLNIVTIFITFK